ncbi:hypothetical protein GCM10020331_074720 [Ectobacillus funiculus]
MLSELAVPLHIFLTTTEYKLQQTTAIKTNKSPILNEKACNAPKDPFDRIKK